MHEILKEFSKQFTIDYARQRAALREQDNSPDAYRGPELFPSAPTNELTFEFFKDLNLLPVMASVQAFGAEAQIASREGVERVTGEIPTIKRKIPLNGRALIALRREGAGDLDFVANQLYNDMDNMIDATLARAEKLRMDALTKGKIELSENGVIMTVDYGIPAEHKRVLGTGAGYAKWSNQEDANPIDNIQTWTNKIVDSTGITPTRAWTSNTVVANLLKCVEIRKMIYGTEGATRQFTLDQLNNLLQTMNLPIISTYNARVRQQKNDGEYVAERFFDEKKFVLMPEGKLGDLLVGPTEEAMLDTEVDAKEMAGAYCVVYQEMEPPMLWTKAALTAIPTFPAAKTIFQAEVI